MNSTSPSSSSTSASRPDRHLPPAPATRGDAEGPAGPGAGGGPGLAPWLLVLVALGGLALRVTVLATPLGRADADEVLSGLMARHIGSDGFPLFVWGQHYGGTLELVPVALSMKVFGSNVLALRLPNLVLAAVNSLLLWRVARRLLPEAQAQLAGALTWLGPPTAVWFGLREQLFYPPTVTLGLLLAITAFRTSASDRLTNYAWLGLVAGLGWWTSSNAVYYVIPAAAVLLHRVAWRERGAALARGALVAAGAFVLGALPWIVDNVQHDFAALRAGGSFPVIGTYPSRWWYFFTDGLPGALGFRETFTYRWVGGPAGVVAYLLVLVVLAVSSVRALRAVAWDGVGFVAFPFVFAFLPMVMDDPNLRYLFFVVPFVAVLLARMSTTPPARLAVLVCTLLVTLVGFQRLYAVSELDGTQFRIGNVGDLAPVIAVLVRQGVDAVFGDYWVAYRIDFESDERITAAPAWGVDRYPADTARVRAGSRVAWVVGAGAQEQALRDRLTALGVPATYLPAGEFVVVLPSRPVLPEELPEAARHAPG